MITASSDKKPLENATAALETMAECRVDAALTGHLHTSSAECYPIRASDPHRTPWGLVLIQAGTLSLRARGEAGAFNVIRTEKDRISVDRHLWDSDGRAFAISLAETFTRGPHGWSRG